MFLFLLLLLSPAAALVASSFSHAHAHKTRREQRWEAAVATLEATTDARRRFDHRARLARLIGVYVGEDVSGDLGSQAELLVAMQPDQGGRKLLFLDAVDGRSLGFIELETQSAKSKIKIRQVDFTSRASTCSGDDGVRNTTVADDATAANCDEDDVVPVTSALRGMLVADGSRGKGYARLFLAIWLRLCLRAEVKPATTRINKPLLALTLVRLGFTPLRGQHLAAISHEDHLRGSVRTREGGNTRRGRPRRKLKEKHRPLAVEVSVGSGNRVLLYSPVSTERLQNGFSATEVRSQGLVVATEPPNPRGRVAHLRVRYAPPEMTGGAGSRPEDTSAPTCDQKSKIASQIVHVPLAEGVGGRLRLSASQCPTSSLQATTEERADALRLLTGCL